MVYKKITWTTPIPNTRTGHYVTLECGHQVMTFGNLNLTAGILLCQKCKGESSGTKNNSDEKMSDVRERHID